MRGLGGRAVWFVPSAAACFCSSAWLRLFPKRRRRHLSWPSDVRRNIFVCNRRGGEGALRSTIETPTRTDRCRRRRCRLLKVEAVSRSHISLWLPLARRRHPFETSASIDGSSHPRLDSLHHWLIQSIRPTPPFRIDPYPTGGRVQRLCQSSKRNLGDTFRKILLFPLVPPQRIL